MSKGCLGFVVIPLSLASLLLALHRQQFTLLSWALFFLSISSLLLVAHLIGYLYLRHRLVHINITLPSRVDRGLSLPFTLHLGDKVRLLAIFNYRIVIKGRAPRAFFTQAFALGLEAEQINSLTLDKRAVYELTYDVEAVDLLGFFSHKVKGLNALKPLTVMPPAPHDDCFEVTLPQAFVGRVAVAQRPTDERFDSRKYYPGDDSRLINWHQASRFNELFIKLEERGGGSSNDIVITLLIAPHQKGSEERLDQLINHLISLTAYLSHRGCSCQVIIGNDSIDYFDGSKEYHRLLLSPYFTGQPTMMQMEQHLGQGLLVLMGDMHDIHYLDMVRRYAHLKPLIVSSSSDEARVANFQFLAETFGLEALLV